MYMRPLPVFAMIDQRGRCCGHLQPTAHLPPSLAPPISGRAYKILRHVRVLAVETIPTNLAGSLAGVLLADDERAWPVVLERQQQSVVLAAVRRIGLDPARLDRSMVPIGLALYLLRATIHELGETLPVLDELMVEVAIQHNVAVTALESVARVSASLAAVPLHIQCESLMELSEMLLTDPDELFSQLLKMADWTTRAAYDASAPTLLEPLGISRFLPQLAQERNPAIARRIVEMAEWCCGRVIFAVGAAHFPGSDGLCALLAEERIEVERVYVTGESVDLMHVWSARVRTDAGLVPAHGGAGGSP